MKTIDLTSEKFELILTKMRIFEILSEGCKRHPTYRAKRKPRDECIQCNKMWNLKQKLNTLKR